MNRKKFIEQVKIAFADVQYPGDDHIIVDTHQWTCLGIAEDFKGKHWSEITGELARDYQLGLSCFTPEAFQFFLPGLLIARFIYPEAVELEAFLTYTLIPGQEGEEEIKRLTERVKYFTTEQKDVVRTYIKDFFENNPFEDEREGERTREFWKIEDRGKNKR